MIGRIFKKIKNYYWFFKCYHLFKKNNDGRFELSIDNIFPCFNDNKLETSFDSHYIYHPAWAARIVKSYMPDFHVDISSTLHFSTLLSAFIPVKFFDFRPAQLNLSNLTSGREDLTSLSFPDNSIVSLSCMHTVEHIGLGRYGDKIDPTGDLKAMNELKRVLSVGGSLLFVVPVGKSSVVFNAHRIYDYEQVIGFFSDLSLKQFSLVTDSGEFIEFANKNLSDSQSYGCGCFWFSK